MAELTAKLVVFSFCASVALVTVGAVLPWITKLVALYGLHSVRERVYAVKDEFPAAAKTRLYRDMEFLVTMAIHVVRERPFSEAVAYLGTMLSSKRESNPERDARAQRRRGVWDRERRDVFGPSRDRLVEELITAPSECIFWMMVRVGGGRPTMQALSILMLVYVATRVGFRMARRPRVDLDAFSSAVPRMPGKPPRAATFEGMRVIRDVGGLVWTDQAAA
jgi:hypothetical protein